MSGPLYFYEDEVCRTTKYGDVEFGMVMENWEMYSSDEEDDDTDPGRVQKGYVSVNWHPKGKEETVQESRVKLSDRSLMPGDVVRRLDTADTQRGYCRAVKVSCAVQIVGTKKVIPNVVASNIRPVQALQSDIAVYLDSWVGVIRDVRNTLTLRFADNSSCTIESHRLGDHFEDTRRSDGGFNNNDNVFYPGQKLRGSMKYLKEAKWIHRSDDMKRAKDRKIVTVTVISIEPTSVTVQWQWQAPGSSVVIPYKAQACSVPLLRLQDPICLSDSLLPPASNGLDTSKMKYQRFFHHIGMGAAPAAPTLPSCTSTDSSAEGPTKSLSTTSKLQQTLSPIGQVLASAISVINRIDSTINHEQAVPRAKTPPPITSLPEAVINGLESNQIHPPDMISGDALKRLKCLNLFDSSTVQLGDISFYIPTAKDRESILERSVWRKVVGSGSEILELASTVQSTKSLSSLDIVEAERNSSETEEIFDKTLPDICTCNSNNKLKEVEIGVKGNRKKHFPRVSLKSLRDKKLKKSKPHPVVNFVPDREVVVEAIHTSSFVDVVWQDGTIQEGVNSVELYPIHHLDDHEFFPGDFVVRAELADSVDFKIYGVIQHMNHSGRVALVQWFEAYAYYDNSGKQEPKLLEMEEMSVYDLRDHPEFRFRPGTIVIRVGNVLPDECSAGQIVDNYPDGQVRVWWTTTGNTSSCWPQELFRLADYDSDEGEIWDDHMNDEDGARSDSSWETDEEEPDNLEDTPSNQSIVGQAETAQKMLTHPCKQMVPTTPTSEVCTAEVLADPYYTIACAERFILVESLPAAHRFRFSIFQPQNPRNFLKTVQKEVQLFRENLPSGIYVKGFEDRMDLYSIMICGPQNTPYEDGIFLFDVQLPSNYPHAPPLVHYTSFCTDRLNPNLYECGKVCVSLLGTWSGRGTEVWSSSESSLLQLLVSIQGLILVSEPYYNEAGYEKQKGSEQGKENSRMYNEMVLIKLVQSMSRQLTSPPEPWAKEIKQHIYLHGPRLIKRCREWLCLSETSAPQPESATKNDVEHLDGGDVVVKLDGNDKNSKLPGFTLLPVSKGFSITLKKTLDNFAKICDPSIPSSTSASAINNLLLLDGLD